VPRHDNEKVLHSGRVPGVLLVIRRRLKKRKREKKTRRMKPQKAKNLKTKRRKMRNDEVLYERDE